VDVLADVDALPSGLAFVATLGVFDGVHLGHRHVLDALTGAARDLDATPVAITFDPHPAEVISGRAPAMLCSLATRVRLLGEAGAAVVVVQRFDEAFRRQSAETFLGRLQAGRELRALVVSPESAFGSDRRGTIDLVRRLAAGEGWRLVEVDTLEVDGERVSSGRIRALLDAGDRAAAARLLGRSEVDPGVDPAPEGAGQARP
jgi:riboflavin kinase/FMN adenylyltransferase